MNDIDVLKAKMVAVLISKDSSICIDEALDTVEEILEATIFNPSNLLLPLANWIDTELNKLKIKNATLANEVSNSVDEEFQKNKSLIEAFDIVLIHLKKQVRR